MYDPNWRRIQFLKVMKMIRINICSISYDLYKIFVDYSVYSRLVKRLEQVEELRGSTMLL